ncbi:MAG: calcium-binding protein [Pseudomonadota bacterium]
MLVSVGGILGAFFEGWRPDPDSGERVQQLFGRSFLPDGTAIMEEELELFPDLVSREDNLDATILANGDVLLVFDNLFREDNGQLDRDVLTFRFDPGSGIVEDEGLRLLVSASDFDEFAPVVTALPDGGYVVAHSASYERDGQIVAVFYDENDVEITSFLGPQDFVLPDFDLSRLAVLPTGETAWLYRVFPEAPDAPFSLFQLVLTADEIISDSLIPGVGTTGAPFAMDNVALTGGEIVVGWQEADGQGFSTLQVALLAFDGSALDPQDGASLFRNSDNSRGGLDLVATPDGGFVAAWHEFGANGRAAVYLQHFAVEPDLSGAQSTVRIVPSDDPIRVSPRGQDSRNPSLTVQEDGSLAVAWAQRDTSAGARDVLLRILDATEILFLDGGTVEGTPNDDLFDVRRGADGTLGNSGVVLGFAGNDTVLGSSESELIDGGSGRDFLLGGDDDDSLVGGRGNDTLDGQADDDSLRGGDDEDSLVGGRGNDTLDGQADDDFLRGGRGDDVLRGGDGADVLDGEWGRDTLEGGADGDQLEGGDGSDELYGEGGNDLLNGELGDDQLSGGNGRDTLRGEDGSDTLDGDKGRDLLLGGRDADLLRGGEGNDTLSGQQGDDTLNGGKDGDLLEGGRGRDSLIGWSGDDTLDGGTWQDTLNGGGGDDVFILRPGYQTDTILNLGWGDDRLFLDAALWSEPGIDTGQEVVAQFGRDTPDGYLLDFSSAAFLVPDLAGMDGAADDIAGRIVIVEDWG